MLNDARARRIAAIEFLSAARGAKLAADLSAAQAGVAAERASQAAIKSRLQVAAQRLAQREAANRREVDCAFEREQAKLRWPRGVAPGVGAP